MVVSMMTSRNPLFVNDDPLSSYLRDRGLDPSRGNHKWCNL